VLLDLVWNILKLEPLRALISFKTLAHYDRILGQRSEWRCCWKFLSPHMSTSIAMVLRYKILQNRLTKWWPNIGEAVCICGSFHFRTFLGVLLVGQFYRRQPTDWTNRLHSHVQVGSWLCHLGAVQFKVSWSDFEGICNAIVTFGPLGLQSCFLESLCCYRQNYVSTANLRSWKVMLLYAPVFLVQDHRQIDVS
jgi:hypothetical protein